MPESEPGAIQRWSTDDVPQADRLEYFAAALSEATEVPVGVVCPDPRSFHARVSYAHLSTIGVSKMMGSPHRAFRGPSELSRTGDHRFNLMMGLTSSWSANHRGPLRLSPRDVLIHDSQFPVDIEIRDRFTGINVAVTDAWLRQWLPNPGVLVARRIEGDSPWGHALASYLAELSPELAAAPPVPLSLLADQVGSLLALTASALRGETVPYTSAARSLHERIGDCIMQRCTDSALTAADVARSLNISLRTLHRTLAAAHEVFGTRLIDARVRVAQRMLASPQFNRLTTAEIGVRAGFLSASHFARALRKRTGRTPLQLRRGG